MQKRIVTVFFICLILLKYIFYSVSDIISHACKSPRTTPNNLLLTINNGSIASLCTASVINVPSNSLVIDIDNRSTVKINYINLVESLYIVMSM